MRLNQCTFPHETPDCIDLDQIRLGSVWFDQIRFNLNSIVGLEQIRRTKTILVLNDFQTASSCLLKCIVLSDFFVLLAHECLCLCACVYMYVRCLQIYTCMHAYIYACISVFMYVWMYVCICRFIHIYACMSVFMSVWMYVCICTFLYLYVCMYTRVHSHTLTSTPLCGAPVECNPQQHCTNCPQNLVHVCALACVRVSQRKRENKNQSESESLRKSQRESERARKRESERARGRESDRARAQESERVRERESTKARKQEGEGARERERMCARHSTLKNESWQNNE